MKRFLSFLATGALALLLTTSASAQTRGVSGGALILDDLHGNALTLTTPLYGSPEWEAWAFEGFPSVWYAPVPPANGAQDAFIYSGPIPAYGTGSISPALIAYWVPPGVTGINNPGGAAGAWDYATAGQLGISGAGDNLDQYVIPMSDGAGDWVASTLTDNGTVNTTEDLYANSLNLPNSYSLYSPATDNLTLGSLDNTFNLVLNTDNTTPGAGLFTMTFDGNGSPTFDFSNANMSINGSTTEIDLNGDAGTGGEFLESQGGATTPIWATAVTEVDAGTGLIGGPINTTGTLSIANSGVEAGTYGDATDVGQFTVNAQGQITSASDVSILLPNANLVNSTIGLTNADGSLTVGGSPISLGGSGTVTLALGHANTWTAIQSFPAGSLTNAELAHSTIGLTNADGSLTIGTSPISLGGSSTLTLALGHANTWTAIQTFPNLSITVPELASSTIGHTSTGSTLVVPGAIGLGNSGNFEINLAHANTWTAAQTFPAGSITNAELANSSVTVTAGTGLSGGGTATLGGAAVTLTNAGVTSITGTASQITASASTGAVTLSLPATINVNTTGNAATATTAGNVTGVVAIANGGTGQTTASTALNALLPTQTGNSGKFLTTNGTNASWGTVAGGGGTSTFTHKATAETVTNSVTFQPDNDITLSVPAGATEVVNGTMYVTSTSSTPDVKFEMTSTQTSNFAVYFQGRIDNGANAGSGAMTGTGATTSTALTTITITGGSLTIIQVSGYITNTSALASTVTLDWAQNTANAAGTSNNATSYWTWTQY